MKAEGLWRSGDRDTADEPERFFPVPGRLDRTGQRDAEAGTHQRAKGPARSGPGRDGPVKGAQVKGQGKNPARRRMRRVLASSDWLLAIFGVVFLVAYAVPILWPHIPHAAKQACTTTQLVAWIFFAIDYFARLWAARDRKRYFKRHLVDLFIVVAPAFAPALGALRLLRLVVLFRVLNRRFASALQGRVALYVSLSAGILVFTAALAVLDAERGQPGAKISNFGNAIWWAMTTVTTVGYGDYFPVTTTGRVIAVGLMIGGVALIGVVTASFAAWFIDRVRVDEEEQAAATQRDLKAIAERLDIVTAELVELRRAANRAEQERRELSSP